MMNDNKHPEQDPAEGSRESREGFKAAGAGGFA